MRLIDWIRFAATVVRTASGLIIKPAIVRADKARHAHDSGLAVDFHVSNGAHVSSVARAECDAAASSDIALADAFFGDTRGVQPAFSRSGFQDGMRALFIDMLDPEFDRVHACRDGQFVHEGFHGERCGRAFRVAQMSGAERRSDVVKRRNDMRHGVKIRERIRRSIRTPLREFIDACCIAEFR